MRSALVLCAVGTLVLGVVLTNRFEAADGLYAVMLSGFGSTGWLIAGRQPRNPIGWLFLGCALAAGLASVTHGLVDEGIAGGAVAVYASASWMPLMVPPLTFLLLLFPDGRLLSRRWRWVARCAGAGLVIEMAAAMLRPGPTEDYPAISNPIGVAGTEILAGLGALLLLIGLVGGPVALTRRFRRSDRLVRQQIRWILLAGGFAAVVFVGGLAGLVAGLPESPIYVAIMTSVASLPAAAGVAILRYRLYDIDLVVRRTLVYAVLTATLAAVYLGSVLLLGLVLPARSDLAVAVSTLAAAALVGPARRRIQAGVNRRFYRRGYDAEQTLAAFGLRLRDQLDLDAVTGELQSVAADTMQPATVSVWMR